MRTRLTVCVGTGVPHGHEGGLQGLEQGGAEERGPTETEERRQTGQPSKESKVFNETGKIFFYWASVKSGLCSVTQLMTH